MGGSTIFSVSLPPAMAKEIERAMKSEHRTPSELVREALRVYLSARLIPAELPTSREALATAGKVVIAAIERRTSTTY